MHVESALVAAAAARARRFKWPQSLSLSVVPLSARARSHSALSFVVLSSSPLLYLPVQPPSCSHWPVSCSCSCSCMQVHSAAHFPPPARRPVDCPRSRLLPRSTTVRPSSSSPSGLETLRLPLLPRFCSSEPLPYGIAPLSSFFQCSFSQPHIGPFFITVSQPIYFFPLCSSPLRPSFVTPGVTSVRPILPDIPPLISPGQGGMVSRSRRVRRHRRIPCRPQGPLHLQSVPRPRIYTIPFDPHTSTHTVLADLPGLAPSLPAFLPSCLPACLAMAFDLVILLMTISGLCFIVPAGRSGLWKLLFTDGIAYFTLVASVNSIPAVCPVPTHQGMSHPLVFYALRVLGLS